MSPMHQIDTLLTGLLDGTLSEAEHARLATLIAADDAALARYLTMIETDSLLDGELSPIVEPQERLTVIGRVDRTAPRAMTIHRAALAATVVIAALVGVYAWTHDGADREQPPHSPIAVMLDSTGSGWTTEPREAGDELTPQTIGLSSGLIELETRSGAVVRAIGPLRMSLATANTARLDAGRIVARAPRGAEGFTVHTPGGLSVVDLGTEFAVSVEGDRVAVTVYEGEVELRIADRRERITAGHGMVYDERSALFVADDGLKERFADLRSYRLDLTNGDFESGTLTAWTAQVTPASDLKGTAVFASAASGIDRAPDGQTGGYATRLGFKYQRSVLRQISAHAVNAGADYTLVVRAAATDADAASSHRERFRMSLRAAGRPIADAEFVADDRWRWYTLHVDAARLSDVVGQTIEIEFEKPAATPDTGDFVWIDDVQLWRGVMTEQTLAMDQEIKNLNPSSEGDEP